MKLKNKHKLDKNIKRLQEFRANIAMFNSTKECEVECKRRVCDPFNGNSKRLVA